MASIVDKPKESKENDLLEIEKYTNGLIAYIESSATPMTIGIQGEWGSGKTSLLNTIKEDLCDKDGSKHYPIWLNTWEYSLLSTPDETLIKIIVGLIEQIGSLTKNTSEESFKKVSSLGKSLLARASGAGGMLGMAAGVASDVTNLNESSQENSIRELRESLQVVINKAIESSDKQAFIFFIDDLDRLDPSIAVNILELIKNLFDLKNCIFVLAIDYGVVVKGLQSKFGVMTEENEWEFRAFFDKIIQLPFSMPISSYNIEKYLKSLLVDVNYFEKSDLENEDTLKKIAEIVGFSAGTNPRALKRLANSVSLIEIIRGNEKITPDERVIEFALICIQIAYPIIYGLIQKESDFTTWNEQFVYEVLKNKKPDESDLIILENTDEFDEEWEQNVWRICQVSTFLKQKVYQLSKLLNFIKKNIPSKDMNETIDKLLRMSSVTSVSAENTLSISKTRTPRKKQMFESAMEEFREDELLEQYSQYFATDYISAIKIISKKDTGNLFLSINKDSLNFDFCIWINYSSIVIYVNNKNAKSRSRKETIKWFEKHLKSEYQNMKLNDNSGTRKEIVTLDAIQLEEGISRTDAIVRYKEIVKQTLDIFLPKIFE